MDTILELRGVSMIQDAALFIISDTAHRLTRRGRVTIEQDRKVLFETLDGVVQFTYVQNISEEELSMLSKPEHPVHGYSYICVVATDSDVPLQVKENLLREHGVMVEGIISGPSSLYSLVLDVANEEKKARLVRNMKNTEAYKEACQGLQTESPLKYFLSPEAEGAFLESPKRAYADDAGYDLRLLSNEPLIIPPHERRPIPTGVGFEIPSGWYGLICNRTSGGRRGLLPLAQVVDASYTGFLTLTLHNTNDTEEIRIEPGERVAQIVFMPIWTLPIQKIQPDQVKQTDRGSGAYGSSGKI